MHEPHMSVVVTCTLQTYGTLHVFFAAQATFHNVSYCFLRGIHPLPDQLPGEHTGLHLMWGSTSFIVQPFSTALCSYTCS